MMDRRTFAQSLATAAIAAAVPPLAAQPVSAAKSAAPPSDSALPYGLSVMLWTVFKDIPAFEDRMAKVVESGYTKIQLVGEYSKWAAADFDKAVAAQKRLGI